MAPAFSGGEIYVPERDTPTTIPDSTPTFTYDALPTHESEKYFRLLKIKPAIFLADVLDCELIVAPVAPSNSDSTPPFDALSYAWSLDDRPSQQQIWAPITGPKEILVNGKRLVVQESLAAALHRYRRLGCSYLRRDKGPWKGKAEYIWADAICIDQSNLPEKTSQVSMMHEIYRRARRVFIDLGIVRDDWISALCLMDTIQSITSLMHYPRGPAFFDDETISDIFELPPVDHIAWNALGHTLEMPWFRRTWVVQEMALPRREPIAMFGRYCFGLEKFFKVLDFIQDQGYHNALSRNSFARDTGLVNAVKMHGIRRNHHRGTLFSVALLERIRDFAARDPRDKVFGVLSLMPGNERILPDYSLAVDQAYTRYAKQIIIAGYGPRLLDTAGLQRRTPGDPLSRTWVPDWRAQSLIPRIISHIRQHPYRASGPLRQNFSLVPPNPHPTDASLEFPLLKIQAYPLDTILATTDILFPDLLLGKSTPFQPVFRTISDFITTHRALCSARYNTDNLDDITARTLLMDDLYLAQENTLLTYSEITYPGENFRTMMDDAEAVNAELKSETRKMSPLKTFQKQTNATLPDRRLGVTRGGYMGIFPGVAEEGDGIFIVAGAGVPFVLREVMGEVKREEVRRFQLVGDAYVHGVMYGEALGLEGFEMGDVLLV
ncbi:heterokaryon incompatibility protein-domain-containing protein [Podospora aff. communis PSN243]|uniref:Heterokaryon incompatibility protein-domain-containing protein n=1 Tax=Podospora aff. communis PSN243 TaxID=3040156 RepID=A0AAV9GNK9_9PEZI|nr:heterokaryon incompatibility protein-domain-containing protein [Podospora aff. communis PSN243]